ncbi:MAG: hypothetical protein P1V81_04480 [Planctomycetota bacterium]|nr:hypothetical protein [Planctomycetota bacterium]
MTDPGLADAGAGGTLVQQRRELEQRLRKLQGEHGHGHPEALEVAEQLADLQRSSGKPEAARKTLEEVLIYRAVLEGDQALRTALVARDLFALLCAVDDRPAMAEVYYRFLSWIPMHDPSSLTPELRVVLTDVERLLVENT